MTNTDVRLSLLESKLLHVEKQQEKIIETQEKIVEQLNDLVIVWNQAKAVRWVLSTSVIIGGIFLAAGEKLVHLWKALI